MSAPRVLLVDDDREICQFLALLLELEGFAPLTATRAEQAIEIAQAERPAALLVDLTMPDLDGFELCRRLRSARVTAPILVVSALPGQELDHRAQQAGADDFIRKPFDNSELVARIRHWVSARAPRAPAEAIASAPMLATPAK